MVKNLTLSDIILIAVLGMFVYNTFFITEEAAEPIPITINIPESTGTSGTQYVEPKIVVVQVPVGNNQSIDVDAIWKERYEKATQKMKDSLYNEAIRINKYNDTLVNDDRVTITGDATTRGSLLDFKVDYTIKPLDYTYTPEVVTKRAKLTFDIRQGVQGFSLPSLLETRVSLPTQLGFTNQKGWSLGYSYDLLNNTHGGYIGKSYTLIK